MTDGSQGLGPAFLLTSAEESPAGQTHRLTLCYADIPMCLEVHGLYDPYPLMKQYSALDMDAIAQLTRYLETHPSS